MKLSHKLRNQWPIRIPEALMSWMQTKLHNQNQGLLRVAIGFKILYMGNKLNIWLIIYVLFFSNEDSSEEL